MRVTWKIRKVGSGYEGWVILPFGVADLRAAQRAGVAMPAQLAPGMRPLAIKARADSGAGALASAAGFASGLMNNPLIQAALPPGSAAAVKAIQMLAKAGAAGKIAKVADKLIGPGAKRLGKTLKKLKFW